MAGIKTKPTGVNVDEYLASRASPERLADCHALVAIGERITRQPPQMWGPSIVGHGRYTYRYDSGHPVLEALIAASVADVRRRHPDTGDTGTA